SRNRLASVMPGALGQALFSPDGRSLITYGADVPARRWEMPTGRLLGPAFDAKGAILQVMVDPKDNTLRTLGADHGLRRWNAATGQPIGEPLRWDWLKDKPVFFLGGRKALTQQVKPDRTTAYPWDTETGRALGPALRFDESLGLDRSKCAMSPDARTLVIADD